MILCNSFSPAMFDSEIKANDNVQMVYARLNIIPDRLFQDVIINTFIRNPDGKMPTLGDPVMVKMRRAIFRRSSKSDYGKELRWFAESNLQPFLINNIFSRNQLLNESVEVFQNRSSESTDILHDYFIP